MNSFQRQHQKTEKEGKQQQLIIGFSARVELPRNRSPREVALLSRPPVRAAPVLAFPHAPARGNVQSYVRLRRSPLSLLF